jgi:hypothetical protein
MTATIKQTDFIRILFDERKDNLSKPEYLHILQMPMNSSWEASKLINALKGVPKDHVEQKAPDPEPGVYMLDDTYVILYHHPDYGIVGKYWSRDRYQFKRLNRAKHHVRDRGRLATDEERESLAIIAGDIGKNTKTCQFCMRPLTDGNDGHSIDRGYGPICANKYGLPWGVDTPATVSS